MYVDRMDVNDIDIKTLPINVASCSKGYITYNSSKIDIIPISLNTELDIKTEYDETEKEMEEKRIKHLISKRDKIRYKRQQETAEQRSERLRKDREKKREYRAKMKQDDMYEEVLERNRIIMRVRRQNETYRERERERDRIRHQIRRADVEFRSKEKVKERGRKRLSRFLKKYAQQYSEIQCIAQKMLQNQIEHSNE